MAGGRGRPSDRAVQSTIQSIKEVVGGHSDDDIYAALRESNMDPNETAQKLLNQGPFHEVKRKREKKRENADHKCFVDTKELVVQAAAPWVKSQTHWIQNGQRRAHDTNQSSGPSPEFRIVRDNRFQQGAVDHRPEPGRKISANVKVFHQREAAVQSDQGHILQGAKNNSSSEVPLAKGEVQGNPERHTKPYSKDPMNRRHFSTSDTVDVPYLNSKAAVTVETIHHQVRGVTRQPSRKSVSQLHVSSSYSHANIQRGDFTSAGPSGLHSTYMSKNIQSNQRPTSGTAFRGRSIGRSSTVPQSSNKYHQGAASNLQAVQPNKEWKPKVIKNPSSIDVDDNGANLESPSTSKMGSDNVTDVISLCEKISHANIHGKEHVIIPEYLRVPDYEHAGLKFGSFTTGLDSDHEQTAPSPESENSEQVPDSGHLVIGVGLVDVEHDEMDEHARSSQHDPSTSTAKISISPSDEGEHMNAHEFGNADGLGLVRSDTTLIGAPDERNIRNTSSLPTFSAYGPKEPQANNDASLYGLVEPNVHPQVLAASSLSYPSENPEANNGVQVFRIPQHNVHSQVLHSTSEAQSSQLTSSSPVEISLQQQLSQPHPAAQLYPPVHVQHFPNFMPYHRLVYSPVYVPPMAMPNYSTNVAYPHPSNGNNYLQMPGGSSHLTAGGMKYGPSQYKSIPVGNPSGYGNYTHPAGLDDVNSIKYNDNDLCASAQQVETPEMWIQTPREIPALQSSPYYNLTGQATPGAYLANLGNASFGATAQASHAQFPGLYHPQQPPSIVSPHHVVHQQVPSAVGANVGFGVAAPGPQVGAFQQSQIGHQNWRGNF